MIFPNQNSLLRLTILFSGISLAVLFACNPGNKQTESETPSEEPEPVMEIVTEAMDFQMPDTIPSGWYVWKYHNRSNQPHFILIDEYPDHITLDSIQEKVFPPFEKGINLINEGKNEQGFAEFEKLPAWYSEVILRGGVGLVSPQTTSETILYLDPGVYFLECYVKMSTGMFHTNMGMIKKLVVSEEVSSLSEPIANLSVRLSNENGIVVPDPPAVPGYYIFGVHTESQQSYENFVQHDLNLVRLEDNADLKALEAWMDWRDPKGLIEPAPEGVVFLGGVNDLPKGGSGYFSADLVPGKYAFISEVPDPSQKNLLKVFEISQ